MWNSWTPYTSVSAYFLPMQTGSSPSISQSLSTLVSQGILYIIFESFEQPTRVQKSCKIDVLTLIGLTPSNVSMQPPTYVSYGSLIYTPP
ncbi:unnamed protein product [Coffea canephora]|uniref:Uncharacterized protein n=1 Tax=Coffea canephora TaxID=49390 RepID=A0A068UUI3_COFCA|nr:unnamed protein product [Coffea canephora]